MVKPFKWQVECTSTLENLRTKWVYLIIYHSTSVITAVGYLDIAKKGVWKSQNPESGSGSGQINE